MKAYFLGAVILYAAVSMINSSEYEYQYDNNKTCIKVRTDVVFTLTNWKEIITFDGTNFTVKTGDCAISNESLASLTLITIKEDLLSIEFKTDAQNQTSMDAMFTFAPYEYFPGTPPLSSISLIDNGDLLLGGNGQLYICNPPKKMTLSGTLKGVTYTMYIDMSNTEIQAFNIQDGILSSSDKMDLNYVC